MSSEITDSLSIRYEHQLPEEYVISNRTFDLIVRRGVPDTLISTQYGAALVFKRLRLPSAKKMDIWPNGCKVTFDGGDGLSPVRGAERGPELLTFTTPDSSEVYVEVTNVRTLAFTVEVPLSMEVKVPFVQPVKLRRQVDVHIQGEEVSFGDVVVLRIIRGKLSKVDGAPPEKMKFVLSTSSDRRLILVLAHPGRNNATDQELKSAYKSYLNELVRLSNRFDEQLRRLYAFSLNTALGLFKTAHGRTYVSAGMNYSFPRRTYFRDSFWTVLPVLSVKPGLVREQVLTLADGVHADGCPSAVFVLSPEETQFLREVLKNVSQRAEVQALVKRVMRYETDWWSDHHDSCAFFVLLLAEYIMRTGDDTILGESVREGSVGQQLLRALDHVFALNKDGLFRKPRDTNEWADNVYREGIVTYLAGLHLAALKKGAEVLKRTKLGDPTRYVRLYETRRRELNRVVFSKERGYFVNFSNSVPCDNLSLDVVVPMLFGVLDDEQSRVTLEHMEKYLETRNNPSQPYGDWGVMCVWPLYGPSVERFGKSAFPYRYHNGACWPYLSSLYALAKHIYGLDWRYPLLRWWEYSLEKGWVNPVEYYSPPYPRGSLNQGWSAVAAWVIENICRRLE